MTENQTQTTANRTGMESISSEIGALERASVAELRLRYKKVFGEVPATRHRQALLRRLAWRLQALAEGDLSERARNRAQSLARDADLRLEPPRSLSMQGVLDGSGRNRRDCRLPEPGTVLTRRYEGKVISVEVLEESFRYEGLVYRSLSAVARQITDTQWNGFLYFGLTGPWSKP